MIHPTAIVSPAAHIDPSVEVGPYTIIGDGVRIGRGTRIAAHVLISGNTEIGEDNEICFGCVIGVESQIKAAHGSGGTRIGRGNILREYVTVHASGTKGSWTVIGDQNFLMTSVHVAHDCRLESHIIIANGAQLSGHVEIDHHAFVSGVTGIHQYVRIGEHAMVGGLSKLVTDVIPFALCDGNPAQVRGVNVVGLRRAGFATARIRQIKQAVQILYFSGALRGDAIRGIEPLAVESPDVRRILDFVAASKRGIAPRAVSAAGE